LDSNSSKYTYANWGKLDVFLQTQNMPEENFYRDSIEAINRFKIKKFTSVIKALQAKMMEKGITQDTTIIILKALQTLQDQRKELAEITGTVVLR